MLKPAPLSKPYALKDWKLYSEQDGWNLQARGPSRGLKNLYAACIASAVFSRAVVLSLRIIYILALAKISLSAFCASEKFSIPHPDFGYIITCVPSGSPSFDSL